MSCSQLFLKKPHYLKNQIKRKITAMERYNFQAIEKNGKSRFLKHREKGKNFTVLKCFPIRQEKYTWAMLEIILLEM